MIWIAIAAVGAVLLIWLLPKLQVRAIPDADAKDRFSSENEARKTIAQVLSGLFFFGTLYFTWQSSEVSRQQLATSQKQLAMLQQQSISGRFAKAVEQLADPRDEIRLGAIYSLENISTDSQEHYWQVMEVLTSYVRRKSPWVSTVPPAISVEKHVSQPAAPEDLIYGELQCAESTKMYGAYQKSQPFRVTPEIQTILEVLGRRKQEYEQKQQRLNLRHADLRGANLRGLNFRNAAFDNSNLSGCDLREALLDNASLLGTIAMEETLFGEANLKNANLSSMLATGANFYQANLTGAVLSGACLDEAQLGEAILFKAKLDGSLCLRNAQLSGTNLRQTSFEFASLQGADLTRADFSGADMYGIYRLTCNQLNTAFTKEAKRLPGYLHCR